MLKILMRFFSFLPQSSMLNFSLAPCLDNKIPFSLTSLFMFTGYTEPPRWASEPHSSTLAATADSFAWHINHAASAQSEGEAGSLTLPERLRL